MKNELKLKLPSMTRTSESLEELLLVLGIGDIGLGRYSLESPENKRKTHNWYTQSFISREREIRTRKGIQPTSIGIGYVSNGLIVADQIKVGAGEIRELVDEVIGVNAEERPDDVAKLRAVDVVLGEVFAYHVEDVGDVGPIVVQQNLKLAVQPGYEPVHFCGVSPGKFESVFNVCLATGEALLNSGTWTSAIWMNIAWKR